MKQSKKDKIQESPQQLSLDFNSLSKSDDGALSSNHRTQDFIKEKKGRIIQLHQLETDESIFSSILKRRID